MNFAILILKPGKSIRISTSGLLSTISFLILTSDVVDQVEAENQNKEVQ